MFACGGLPPFREYVLMPFNLGWTFHDIFSKVVPDSRAGPWIGLFRLQPEYSMIPNQSRIEAGWWDFTVCRHPGNFGFPGKRTGRIGLHMQQCRDT